MSRGPFANEGLIDELKNRGLVEPGRPLTTSPKELICMSLKHMQSETRRFEFDGNLYDYGAGAYFWTVAAGRDLLFHSGNWAPILIAYDQLVSHDTSAFERWTLDGDYIYRNFPSTADIYVVQNTSEMFIGGFTAESKVHYSTAPFFPYRFEWLRRWLKIQLAHQFLYSRRILDSDKRELFRLPICLQGGESSEAAGRQAEEQAAAIVRRIENNRKSVLGFLIGAVFDCAFRVVKLAKICRVVLGHDGADRG